MDELVEQIGRAKDGDLAAYGEIVRRFQDMAYGCAYAVLSDFHLAEDAAQDAFVEAYRKLGDLREPKAFPGWFRRIVLGCCNRLIRKNRVPTVSLEEAASVQGSGDSPDREVEKMEMKDKVLAAIESLPDGQRMATTLFYINGYSQNEVADFLEVPVSTVKKRLHDSRRKLKERMVDMVADTLKSHALKDDFKEKILHKMEATGRWGHWETDGDERVAFFHGGPSTTLVSPRSWPGDALVVEFDAIGEEESQWGLHIQCVLNPYSSREEQIEAKAVVPKYRVSCGRREKCVWSSINFDSVHTRRWSRDVDVIKQWGDFNGIQGKWYHIKAERIGHMLRLWLDGVVISEYHDASPIPKELFVQLQAVTSKVRFRNVEVSRPDDSYIKTYGKPVPIFAPIRERDSILSNFDGKTVRQASIILGEENHSEGIIEIPGDKKPIAGVVNGKTYKSSSLEDDVWGVFLKIDDADRWDPGNQVVVEFEHYDSPVGDMAAFYRTWHYHGTPTPDFRQTGQEEWVTSRCILRDATFSAPQTDDHAEHLWFHIVRSEQKNFKLHSVAVKELQYPEDAYQAVLDHYDERISHYMGSDTKWPAGHYLFHKALVCIQNLARTDDGLLCLKKMIRDFPDCECIDIYGRMRKVISGLPQMG